MSKRKLEKLTQKHNAFLDRYYEYRQTEMLDGPAVTLFPKQVVKAASRAEAEEPNVMTETDEDSSTQEVPTPRSKIIMDQMRKELVSSSQAKRVRWNPIDDMQATSQDPHHSKQFK